MEYIKYLCSSCEYYDYEDENGKNYCSWYRAYYYAGDSCDHWKQADNLSSGSSGCFMTSACCAYKGLPDDCDELTTMRAFRDEELMTREDTKDIVYEYYRIAPGIVSAINARDDRESLWEGVYRDVCSVVGLVKAGLKERAIEEYRAMVVNYQALVAE